MKHSLLTYAENKKFFNVGDYIQSLAAKQFLPRVDDYLNRELLGKYSDETSKLIMNGWFTHNAANWVPSENIRPLFISFHMNSSAAPLMLSPRGVDYLKQHQPIGCRDHFTANLLESAGIDAYFTGCLTLTLDNYRVPETERTDNIFIVDPLYGYTTWKKVTHSPKQFLRSIYNGNILKVGRRRCHLERLLDPQLMAKAHWIEQEPLAGLYSDDEKFAMASDLLSRYARAKLVITSRIHCALPCLALGTPVIFVNGFEGEVDSCRFGGINELFNRIDMDVNTGSFKSNFGWEGMLTENVRPVNPPHYHVLAEQMKQACRQFIGGEK